ncbi:DUF418 domain-containing protein [Sinosporangium siamense]|uniref:DUF418 domain-containing protein n=1 Tax=Sinosporangium siamense TaxID=1367973 RepID=UPI0019517823|nr:DUF418 domain-containing protein [Sinosporangium siamense]
MVAPPVRRIHEVDAVRGFALAGILIANIGLFADPRIFSAPAAGADGVVGFVVNTLVLSKFYVLFSFLFGYSFTLQMRSAEQAGAGVVGRILRRSLGLFLIGLVHGLLLWPGEILTLYAALGLILLTMRNVKPRTAVITALVILGVVALLYATFAVLATLSPEPITASTPLTEAEGARIMAEIRGGPLEVLGVNVQHYLQTVPLIWFAQGPTAMAMFLLGLVAGKSRLFERLDEWPGRLSAVQWIGFGVGLPAAVLYAYLAGDQSTGFFAAIALTTLTSPLLSAAYVVTLLRAGRRFPAVHSALAPAGRVAASNYIGQSVLCCLVFTGYGLALAGRIPPLGVMGVAVVIYLVLVALSAWWLRKHRYGPVEYVMRRFTNWR